MPGLALCMLSGAGPYPTQRYIGIINTSYLFIYWPASLKILMGMDAWKQSIILYISEVRVSSMTEVGLLFIIIFFTKPWIGSHGYF